MVQKHSGYDLTGEIRINTVQGAKGLLPASQGPGLLPAWSQHGRLTAQGFRLTPAGGTFSGATAPNLNDNDTGTNAFSNVIGGYAEVIFPAALHITQWRQFGVVTNNINDRFKLQYMDIFGNWIDWQTGIAPRDTADWSNWDSSGGAVVAMAIRVVIVTVAVAMSFGEMEVKY